ncbi:MAG: YqhA family protein [Veillonella sp.]|nr:YqhA family protein [Veillonella sp.]
MVDLSQLRKQLFADGRLSAEEVAKLRDAMFDEEGMTRDKGDFLFELKRTVQPELQTNEFKALFVEAITVLLLEDEISPGEIDDSEAKWLRAKIQAKGYRDELDDKLLKNLKEKSINFPEILIFKSKYARWVENLLYFTRYLTVFAVIGSACAAIALFIRGSIIVFQGLELLVTKQLFNVPISHGQEEQKYETMLELFVSSVDIYLFAMVLIIFSVGVYELFINKIDPVERKAAKRPSWLQISSINDLKSSLGKVILMVLIVSFFKHSLELEYKSPMDLLQLGVGVLLIAGALYIATYHAHKKEKTEHDEDS